MSLLSSRDFLDCLGWTLLHFLWQGLVIAALLAAGLRLFRHRSANLRYLVGCAALLLMALAPLLTFNYLSRADEVGSPTFTVQITTPDYNSVEVPATPVNLTPAHLLATKPSVHKLTASERLEAALPWFVVAWSVGVLAFSCRLLAGWLLIQRLRRTATTALIGPWQTRLKELAARVGVSRPLRLLQSACVEVPTVIGWLRPVILLPASCLTGLTPAQLESILAHELAHIRRHDYLINILQNVVETLLFYHPAVWWVSRRIREEREHCCDDLAVKICGDAAAYARALATLEELRPAPAQFALAAAGAPLLERIRRLAGQPERSVGRPAWPVAGVIAIILLALIAVGLRNNPAAAQLVPVASPTNVVERISTNNVVASATNVSTSPVTNAVAPAEITLVPQPLLPPHFIAPVKKLAPPADTFIQTNDLPAPQVNFKAKFAEWDATRVGSNALALMFKGSEVPHLTNIPADFKFTEFLIVKSTNATEPDQFIYLHTNSTVAPLAAFFTEVQYKTAVKNLELQDGVDLLTAPEVTTEIGRQVQIQAVDLASMVVGGSSPGDTNGPQVMTNLPFGPTIDIISALAPDGHTLNLTVIGTVTEFVGYEDPMTVTNKDGQRMPKDWGIPHLRLRQITAKVAVENAETLILGGAPVPITSTEEIKPKVPILGRIPRLDHPFRSSKIITNTVQKSLMLLLTPTLINPDGTRYHVPPTRIKAATIAQEGKLLYEAGKLDEAEQKFKQAAQADPADLAAYEYLRLIREKRIADSTPRSEVYSSGAVKTTENHYRKIEASPTPFNRTNLVYTSKGRQNIISKLNQIRVKSVAYDHLPLGEVINNLTVIARAADPEKTGINFFISREAISAVSAAAPGTLDSATGLPVAPLPTDTGADVGSVTIKINPALNDIRLADVLDAIVKTADKPIKYSILDYAVVFSLRNTNEIALEIRTFHIAPKRFYQVFEKANGLPPGTISSSIPTNIDSGRSYVVNPSNSPDRLQVEVRNFFNSIGANFDTNNPATVSKAFAWNDKKGVLTVRATTGDLDKIGAGIDGITQELDAELEIRNFRVNPDAFFGHLGVELTNDVSNGLKYPSAGEEGHFQVAARRFFNSAGADFTTNYPPNDGKSIMYSSARLKTLTVRATHDDLEKIQTALAIFTRQPPQVNFKVKYALIDPDTNGGWNSILEKLPIDSRGHTNNSPGTLAGILTEPQFKAVLNVLEQRKDMQLLEAQETTGVSGLQAQIQLADSQSLSQASRDFSNSFASVQLGVNSPITNKVTPVKHGTQIPPFSPVVDIIPYVSDDNASIQLTVIPTIAEFIGFDAGPPDFENKDKRGTPADFTIPKNPPARIDMEGRLMPVALPHFRIRQITESFQVSNKQTVIIAGKLTDFHVPFGTNGATVPVPKMILIFVTPTVVNPDGTPVYK